MNLLLYIFFCLLALSLAEKLVKIDGTSGDISDIVVDKEGRWYIVKDKILYSSFDKGKTLNKIELPSKEFAHTGLGTDYFDNLYVQDYKLTLFLVAPTVDNVTYVFEEITLAYGKERLVGRPFSETIGNSVDLATKSGLMYLSNGDVVCKPVKSPAREINNIANFYEDVYSHAYYFSGGNPRYWVYTKWSRDFNPSPSFQAKSFVKYMDTGLSNLFFIVNGEKIVRALVGRYADKAIINGIDASIIDNQTNFIAHRYGSESDNIYVFGNINNSGVVYDLEIIKNDDSVFQATPVIKLDNVRLICSMSLGNEIYFGTSNGVYQLTN